MVVPVWLELVCGGVVSLLGLLVVLCMFCRRFICVSVSGSGSRGVSKGGVCSRCVEDARGREG